MSSRPNPFDDIERLLDRMSRQFDRAASDLGSELEPLVRSPVRIDLEDRGTEFVLHADLPGFERDDVDLRVTNDGVRVEATRATSAEEGRGTYLRRERARQSVSRSISLPERVDEDGVQATFDNGVLTVTLPKREDVGESIQIE